MKPTSILRKLEKDGILQIPKVIRDKLNLHENDVFEIYFDEDTSSVEFRKIQNDS